MPFTTAVLERWNEQLRKHPGLAFGLPVLVTFAVFEKTLVNGFVYDDVKQLLENPFVTNPHLWPRIFTGAVWSFRGGAAEVHYYRPLHIFSYWLVYRVAGPDAGAFHLFQLLLYAGAVLLVFRLGRELLQNELAAFVGALLWALHPLHVEAVAWIGGLPDLGCGSFYLLAFLLFLRGERGHERRFQWHGLAALAYFVALFFKEMALSFPLLLAAYWVFLAGKESWRYRVASLAPYLVALAAYAGIRIAVLGHFSSTSNFWKLSPRILGSALGLLGEHTRLFFWPTHLNVFRSFELGPSLHSPWPWLTLLVVLAACRSRQRAPVFFFLLIWWPVTLLPCLDARQLSFPLLAERFSYLPSVGLCLALSFACLLWLPARLPRAQLTPAIFPGLALVMSLWAIQDWRVIPKWLNNEVLWKYSLRESPNSALIHVFQGLALQFEHGDLDGAAAEFEAALRLNRSSFLPLPTVAYESYIGLGQIALLKGRREEALVYFEKAIRLLPGHTLAYDVLGSVYFPRGEYEKAAAYFARAVELNPQDLSARFYLGTCWMKLGKPRQAAEQFHAAREIDPTYDQAFEAEARALEAAGDSAGAGQARALARKR